MLRNSGNIDPENIDDYIEVEGYQALCKALSKMPPEQIFNILDDITKGAGRPEDIGLLLELSGAVARGSLCALGQTAPNPVLTTIRYFPDEYEAHIREKRCPAGVCKALASAGVVNG